MSKALTLAVILGVAVGGAMSAGWFPTQIRIYFDDVLKTSCDVVRISQLGLYDGLVFSSLSDRNCALKPPCLGVMPHDCDDPRIGEFLQTNIIRLEVDGWNPQNFTQENVIPIVFQMYDTYESTAFCRLKICGSVAALLG